MRNIFILFNVLTSISEAKTVYAKFLKGVSEDSTTVKVNCFCFFYVFKFYDFFLLNKALIILESQSRHMFKVILWNLCEYVFIYYIISDFCSYCACVI